MADKNPKYVSVTKLTGTNTGCPQLVRLCKKEGRDEHGRYRNYHCETLASMMFCMLNKRLYPEDKNISAACNTHYIGTDFRWSVNYHASGVFDRYPIDTRVYMARKVSNRFELLEKLSTDNLRKVAGIYVPLDKPAKN